MATASDDRYPPENILDGKENSFWVTTGLYPHEFVVELKEAASISKIKMWSSHIKKLAIEKSNSVDRFEKVLEVELQDKTSRLQIESHQVDIKAKFVKFVIISGWDDFSAVNKISMT